MTVRFTWADFEKLSEYIYRKTGIHLDEEKHFKKIEKLLSEKSEELRISSFRQYFTKLRFEDDSGDLFQELANAITVNETYFFRENHQFETLANTVLKEVAARVPKHRPIRILSAPSSTGEEPYSIAIHILEEGSVVAERDIEIVGIDIDSTVINKGKEGLYTPRSVHAIPPNLVEKYFYKKGMYYALSDDIKGAIHLQVANVFDKEQMRKLGKFDIIFSRNMLIYFDEASQKEVAMMFYSMLNPGGFVFLGHAEHMSRIVSVFKPLKFGPTLTYQK
ncbi:MAG: protein-glutamate O-methyltransferase CheR [Campylobacterales bacterium]|nr:protein-glutamate O-methyltransferase CheR [Campylobacterales bacterium]